jgi:hypothetical protein
VTRTPPALADVAPGITIPMTLDTIVQRGLKKAVADRIATADDYLALLDEVSSAPPRLLHTPARGMPTASPSGSTRVPRAPTASGGTRAPTEKPPEIGVAPTMLTPQPRNREMPQAARAISLPGLTIPVPRIWIKVAIGIAAIIVLIAIAIVLGRRNAPDTPAGKPMTGQVAVPRDAEAALKALLYDLQTGKTCAERRAVIPKIVELHDAHAIPALKTARFNMHGGVLGLNQDNWNACLKADAEAAVKALGGSLK